MLADLPPKMELKLQPTCKPGLEKTKMPPSKPALSRTETATPVVQPPAPPHQNQKAALSRVAFGWAQIDAINPAIPYIKRDSLCLVATEIYFPKIVNELKCYFTPELHESVPYRIYLMTEEEAFTFNDLNRNHCDNQLVGNHLFMEGMSMIELGDLKLLVEFLKACFEAFFMKKFENNLFGFIRIGGESDVPFVWYKQKRMLPLFYFDGHMDYLYEQSIELTDQWQLNLLKFCCHIHIIRKEHYDKPSIKVVDLDLVKSLSEGGISFKVEWPQKVNPSLLVNPNRTLPLQNYASQVSFLKLPLFSNRPPTQELNKLLPLHINDELPNTKTRNSLPPSRGISDISNALQGPTAGKEQTLKTVVSNKSRIKKPKVKAIQKTTKSKNAQMVKKNSKTSSPGTVQKKSICATQSLRSGQTAAVESGLHTTEHTLICDGQPRVSQASTTNSCSQTTVQENSKRANQTEITQRYPQTTVHQNTTFAAKPPCVTQTTATESYPYNAVQKSVTEAIHPLKHNHSAVIQNRQRTTLQQNAMSADQPTKNGQPVATQSHQQTAVHSIAAYAAQPSSVIQMAATERYSYNGVQKNLTSVTQPLKLGHSATMQNRQRITLQQNSMRSDQPKVAQPVATQIHQQSAIQSIAAYAGQPLCESQPLTSQMPMRRQIHNQRLAFAPYIRHVTNNTNVPQQSPEPATCPTIEASTPGQVQNTQSCTVFKHSYGPNTSTQSMHAYQHSLGNIEQHFGLQEQQLMEKYFSSQRFVLDPAQDKMQAWEMTVDFMRQRRMKSSSMLLGKIHTGFCQMINDYLNNYRNNSGVMVNILQNISLGAVAPPAYRSNNCQMPMTNLSDSSSVNNFNHHL